jgi:predicted metal-dependent peptidase
MVDIFDSISKTSKTLMFKEPFYGLFLISLNKDISEIIPTACVSKRNINCQLTINPTYWQGLDENTKVAVLKHELLHIVFFHLFLQDELTDRNLLNIAADLEVNQYIEDTWKGEKWEGLELSSYPELNLPEKAGTREYYRLLQQIQQNRQAAGLGFNTKQKQRSNGQKGSSGNPIQDAIDDLNESIEENDGSSPEKSKLWNVYEAAEKGDPVVCSHEQWKEFMDSLSEADKKLIKKQVDFQIKDICDSKNKSRGFVPNELEDYINSLFEVVEPVVDWKSYLRRFGGSSTKVYTKKTRRKLNKRYSENPALKIKQKRHILVGMDTSGSVSKDDLLEFFNEIYHIYKSGVTVTIAESDASVSRVYEYKGKMPEFIVGRGGTDFEPIVDYYNENTRIYNTLIYVTDGHSTAPERNPRTPMLWCICSDGRDLKEMEDFPGMKVKITR